ncbi:Ig-like domain-containing protein [Maribacter polysaccharolyticus]|uniref:Ig-like domain-containing protein n=1 Tax=Maribacter polysaccharolyticus TaxID=3020831 RepID=UPI00237F24BA|nr:Ig-like domain-containing protein [Maribacter polysaccharolyticus]MDE3741492.1 Ig-like domain-containing protein [Maribacter polysaccharolyticus]
MICSNALFSQASISGELKQYHKVTLTFDSASIYSETATTYENVRMDVVVTSPSGNNYSVPGYFAADGNAAETSATSGTKWRINFVPNEIGNYTYSVSFKTGSDVAVNGGGNGGEFDGQSGTFSVSATDKTGNDFQAKGKLSYVGKYAPQFANGDYFFEVGADSPETFLEYSDFDATETNNEYASVSGYYTNDDPSWQDGKGTEIIGAVNYLASKGMNVHYFLTNNITGDGKKAYPFPNKTEYTTYDVSKLSQWEIVFDHMYEKGIVQEFVLLETENLNWFEDQEGIASSNFSNSRKIYYRELIARFGYLNVIWNIGEEANWSAGVDQYSASQIDEAAAYIENLSPYNDLITVHNGPSYDFTIFPQITALSGTNSLTAISLQGDYDDATHGNNEVINLRDMGNEDGKKWVVRYTEPWSASDLPNIETWTNDALWASICAGSVGIHYYAGSGRDVNGADYTNYAPYYDRMRFAKAFLEENQIPFWEMSANNENISSGYLLSKLGEYHVVFLKNGGSATINLQGSDDYDIRWFDPKTGGSLQNGSLLSTAPGNAVSIGNPPNNDSQSWVVFLKRNSLSSDIPVTGVGVNPETQILEIGETFQLNHTVSPSDATDTSVEWSSNDTGVASVDGSGMVTAMGEGTAIITVTTVDGGFTDTAEITVEVPVVNVTGVEVTPNSASVSLGETAQLNAAVAPNNATNQNLTWSSDDPAIASVDQNGLVTALDIGTVTITATTADGNFTDTATITINEEGNPVPVQGIRLDPSESTLMVGETVMLVAEVLPSDATDTSVEWSSNDTGVASVDGSGMVTAMGEGTAIITVTTVDGGFTDTAEITVEVPVVNVTGVEVTPNSASVSLGETAQLNAAVAPNNATNQNLTWSSDDPAIASVDQNGLVTALDIGTVTITATTADGNFTDTATITINEEGNPVPVQGIRLDPSESTLMVGETVMLVAEVLPSDATDTSVEWSSNDTRVASVDGSGLVTAMGEGTAIITVTTVDGGFTDTATIFITPTETIRPTLSGNPTVSAVEGEALEIKLFLDKSSEENIVLTIIYENNTANQDDYDSTIVEVTFEPGEVEKTVYIETIADTINEENEQFSIEISSNEGLLANQEALRIEATIVDSDPEDDIIIYPNPTQPFSNVTITGTEIGVYQIHFFTVSGILIKSQTLEIDGDTFELQIPNISNGLYLISLENQENEYLSKILIQ